MDRDARIKDLAERLAALQGTTPDRVIERLLEREWAAWEATPPPATPGFSEETQAPLVEAETSPVPRQWMPTPKAGRQAYMGYWDKDSRVFHAIPLPPQTPEQAALADAILNKALNAEDSTTGDPIASTSKPSLSGLWNDPEATKLRHAQYRAEMADLRARHGLPREVNSEPLPKSFYDEMWED